MTEYYQDFLALFGDHQYLRAGVLIVIFLVIGKVVDWIISRGLARWARRTKTEIDDQMIRLIHRPIFVTVVLIGLWLASLQLDLPATYETLLHRIIKSCALLVWVIFVLGASSLILEVLSKFEDRVTLIQPRTLSLFDTTVKVLVVGGGLYFLFLTWGIDVGGLLMTGGIAGIALGFAAKDTLANLFSGFFILADAPYQVGDFVVLESGERGQVTDVGLRSTRLLTRDDIEVTVPNAVIGNAKIINESGGRWEKERIRVKVGVAYGSDVDRVRRVLMEIAEGNPSVDDDPEPRVRFRRFGDSGLDFELMGWIHEPVLRGRVLDALNTEVYKRFAAEGIEIPYPKRDVYLHQVSPSEDD
ncbi:MAG: mechanosensitive ion channel family protein [Acidobacteria bacterium]|nr:MAG: mechanosensitive ion channel family protein [Acidobacteriota bacterium]